MLAEKDRGKGGGNGSNQHGEPRNPVQREPSSYDEAKQSAGISDTQAKHWQKLAEVDPPLQHNGNHQDLALWWGFLCGWITYLSSIL